jgi:membrane protein YdbS with pleckstrin-like domain
MTTPEEHPEALVSSSPDAGRLERPETEWQRVSPKYIPVDMLSTAIFGAIVTIASLIPFWLGWEQGWILGVVLGAIFVITLALTPRRVRAIGYLLRDDDLLFRRGIMFQRFVAVPYGRMQLVDINRGPLARAFGLAEVKFVTAAASTGVTIPGLPFETAEQLRDHLVAVAETRRAGL